MKNHNARGFHGIRTPDVDEKFVSTSNLSNQGSTILNGPNFLVAESDPAAPIPCVLALSTFHSVQALSAYSPE